MLGWEYECDQAIFLLQGQFLTLCLVLMLQFCVVFVISFSLSC